jgi:hypothetical protein
MSEPIRLDEVPDGVARTSWGQWTFDENHLALMHADPPYRIDLERCTTSAEVLDWIAQVAGKLWATAADVGDLVRALDDVLGLQANICGAGKEHVIVDVRAVITRHRQPIDEATETESHDN